MGHYMGSTDAGLCAYVCALISVDMRVKSVFPAMLAHTVDRRTMTQMFSNGNSGRFPPYN